MMRAVHGSSLGSTVLLANNAKHANIIWVLLSDLLLCLKLYHYHYCHYHYYYCYCNSMYAGMSWML